MSDEHDVTGESETRTPRRENLGPRDSGAAITGAVNAAVFVLGFFVGTYESFTSMLGVGEVPVASIIGVVVNFAMCLCAGLAVRTRAASVLPGVGWLVAVLLFGFGRPGGDLIVTGLIGGQVLLYGGSLGAAAGVVASQVWLARKNAGRRFDEEDGAGDGD